MCGVEERARRLGDLGQLYHSIVMCMICVYVCVCVYMLQYICIYMLCILQCIIHYNHI